MIDCAHVVPGHTYVHTLTVMIAAGLRSPRRSSDDDIDEIFICELV